MKALYLISVLFLISCSGSTTESNTEENQVWKTIDVFDDYGELIEVGHNIEGTFEGIKTNSGDKIYARVTLRTDGQSKIYLKQGEDEIIFPKNRNIELNLKDSNGYVTSIPQYSFGDVLFDSGVLFAKLMIEPGLVKISINNTDGTTYVFDLDRGVLRNTANILNW